MDWVGMTVWDPPDVGRKAEVAGAGWPHEEKSWSNHDTVLPGVPAVAKNIEDRGFMCDLKLPEVINADTQFFVAIVRLPDGQCSAKVIQVGQLGQI
jgi:hypothetical protein